MDESVADIIRRLTEWREDMRASLEKFAAQSKHTAQDRTPDEVTKSLRKSLAFYALATKYHETMARLSRFFNENNTEEKRFTLSELAWWQKLKKLFEIEESFYKQAKEAFAAENLADYEIYSGLAKDALQQISDSIERVDKASEPVPEKTVLPSLPKAGWWQTLTPDEKSGMKRVLFVVLGIGALFYALHFFDVVNHPWTLWRSQWSQYYPWEVKSAKRFNSEKECVAEQWKMIAEELNSQKTCKSLFPGCFQT